jgi:3'(2'), 5'-bisphosphate nucleotidase
MAELAIRFPDDEVRSEEGGQMSGADRLWIVDPLDGSREFGEDRDDWAVHVALATGGHPVVGAVALPARQVVLGTAAPPPLAAPAPVPRLVVSRSRPPAVAELVAHRLGATTIAMGSAGAKIAAVIEGHADIYVHAGGQYEWDSAAPVAVALATGLHASRIDGSPLRYGLPDPWLPDLVVCHPALADAALAALTESG